MQAWNSFLESAQKNLGAPVVDKWLRSLKVVSFDAANLYLEAEDPFQITWFEEHIRPLVKNQLKNGNGRLIKVHLTASFRVKKKTATPIPPTSPLLEIVSDPLQPQFSLDTFLVSEENQIAVSTLFDLPLSTPFYNPIFLFGSPSSGKTHLLTALGHQYKAKGFSVFYVHAETFTSHVVQAIRSGQMERFRETYRHFDLLIVEEVSKFGGRNATQEEFFHTFNALHAQGKQVILSSIFPPHALEGLEPRLISRFEWGLQLSLKPLALEKRTEALQKQMIHLHFPLPEEIQTFLIKQFSSSMASTLKAFHALVLRCKTPETLSLEEAVFLLKDLLEAEERPLPTTKQLLMETARYFAITKEDLTGTSHARFCSLPRKLAMYLCREIFHLSYPEIGKLFKRDHSTVLTSVKQIEEKKAEQEIAAHLEKLKERLEKGRVKR